MLAQVLADPGALDGLAAEGSEIVRDLIEIARIVANVAPRESASSRIRESIAREWSVGAAIHPVAVVDALIGREAIVRVLAAGPHMGPRFD